MPTEHEFKYILSLDVTKKQDLFPDKIKPQELLIRQAYLAFSKGMTTRVRCVECDNNKKWYLTFKQKTMSGRMCEIEKKLDDRDGEDLWEIAIGKLKKERFSFDNEDVKWELDFFIKSGHYYFALVEAELAEGSPRPELIGFLKPFLIYEVEIDDDRFSNKRLGDVEYATRIYHELTKEKYNEQHKQKGLCPR
jgi:CYTH domain-containing protein